MLLNRLLAQPIEEIFVRFQSIDAAYGLTIKASKLIPRPRAKSKNNSICQSDQPRHRRGRFSNAAKWWPGKACQNKHDSRREVRPDESRVEYHAANVRSRVSCQEEERFWNKSYSREISIITLPSISLRHTLVGKHQRLQ